MWEAFRLTVGAGDPLPVTEQAPYMPRSAEIAMTAHKITRDSLVENKSDVVDAGHQGITKAQLIEALEPLPDDAQIMIESDPDLDTLRHIRFVELNADKDGHGWYATLVGPFADDIGRSGAGDK
jgi:hypothetical protein